MKIQPVKKLTLSDGIISELRRLLFAGDIQPGEKLPAERELAEMFKTNRNTLREALSVLQREGFIEARQGAGYFVRDFINEGTLNLIVPLIRDGWSSPVAIKIMKEMLDFRRKFFLNVLEEMHCEVPGDVKRKILTLWEEIEEMAQDSRAVFERDIMIFREIVKASGNTFYLWVFNTVREVGFLLWEVGERFYAWKFPGFYFSTMKKFVNALVSGHPRTVLSTLDEHLKKIDNFTLEYAERIVRREG